MSQPAKKMWAAKFSAGSFRRGEKNNVTYRQKAGSSAEWRYRERRWKDGAGKGTQGRAVAEAGGRSECVHWRRWHHGCATRRRGTRPPDVGLVPYTGKQSGSRRYAGL